MKYYFFNIEKLLFIFLEIQISYLISLLHKVVICENKYMNCVENFRIRETEKVQIID